jgi:hypothetical protein
MSLLEHTLNFNSTIYNKNIFFSSDYKVFIHILQKSFFDMLKDDEIKNTNIFNSIKSIVYDFKIKRLDIDCSGYYEEYERHKLSEIMYKYFNNHIMNGIATNDDLLFFLKDNNIITTN